MNQAGAVSPVRVKICGLKTEATIDAASDAGADMIGLNTFPASPRYVDLDRAAALARHVAGRMAVVALTVDAADELFDRIVTAMKPDWLQLHGAETPERVAEVRRRTGVKVMKAIGIKTADDLVDARAHGAVADRLLFDAKPPKNATRTGGHGREFDWSLLENLDPNLAFMLSGGLTVDNVTEAVRRTAPLGVDVSSGVERELAVKDADMICRFIAAARR